MKRILFVLILFAGFYNAHAAEDYTKSAKYLELRDSMHHGFNSGDSARFFPALSRLEDYLLSKGDLHAYYTQRCNEIVFQMNRQRIFEAYKLASQLSKELREKKLDQEMYMAYNMLGHLNRYCGNKETAKDCFRRVIKMMEEAGYYESMPPIYMNIVNVTINDNPEEALQMLDKAREIALQYCPERVFDIETRKTLTYFNSGDIPRFLKGYKEYRKGVEEGKSSVHGRSVDVYYEACMGNTDKAVQMAREELGEEHHEAVTKIYEQAGRWKEAFQSLREEAAANDSINNVILSNSMQDYKDNLKLYNIEREVSHSRAITLAIIIGLLLLLVLALAYIMFSHRRHMKQLEHAYEHALESDKMKTAFIQNMSHEVRTPLNIIVGFAQIIADPELNADIEKRQEIAEIVQKNTRLITTLIDEMLELSLNEATGTVNKADTVAIDEFLKELENDNKIGLNPGVTMRYESTLPAGFTITTHKGMLRHMVDALLDNAVKNTQQGSITLKTSTDNKQLTLIVEDTGCGIPVQEAEHIFERFVKLDSFKVGLGLGLSLCRLISVRLGGSIHLDTDYKDGARFVVELPL